MGREDPVSRSAVVVGGSLAGLCSALALARDGWRVTIVERSSSVPGEGSGISIDRRLLSEVTGTDFGTLPVVDVGFDATAWGLLWAHIHQRVGRLDDVVRRLGESVLDVWPGEDGGAAVVRTDHGEVYADLVVGADGYGSVVRRSVFPEQPAAQYAGYLLWRGLVPESGGSSFFTGGDVRFAEHLGAGTRLVTFAVPSSDGSVGAGRRRGSFTWFDTTRTRLLHQAGSLDGDTVTGSLAGADVPRDVLDDLQRLGREWPEPWRGSIGGALARRDFVGTPVAEYLPDRLARGRVALVGDAAHVVSPITGAGFHNGLLDIQELAASLRWVDRDVPGALLRYERRRRAGVRRLVSASQAWSTHYLASRR